MLRPSVSPIAAYRISREIKHVHFLLLSNFLFGLGTPSVNTGDGISVYCVIYILLLLNKWQRLPFHPLNINPFHIKVHSHQQAVKRKPNITAFSSVGRKVGWGLLACTCHQWKAQKKKWQKSLSHSTARCPPLITSPPCPWLPPFRHSCFFADSLRNKLAASPQPSAHQAMCALLDLSWGHCARTLTSHVERHQHLL